MNCHLGKDQDAQGNCDKAEIILGQQDRHGEQLLFIQRIEHEDGVDCTGQHVNGETDEHGQDSQRVAKQQAQNTAGDGGQLLESNMVAAAVTPDAQTQLTDCDHNGNKEQIDPSCIVIQELGLPVCGDDLRQRNKEASDAVENEQDDVKCHPELSGQIGSFLQEVCYKVVVSNSQQHHAQQGHVVPYVDHAKQLHTHEKRAAVPQDHNHQQLDECADDGFCFSVREQ